MEKVSENKNQSMSAEIIDLQDVRNLIEKRLAENFKNLERAFVDLAVFGKAKLEIEDVLTGKKITQEYVTFIPDFSYPSPAQMCELPDIEELTKLTKEILISCRKDEDADKKIINLSDYRI